MNLLPFPIPQTRQLISGGTARVWPGRVQGAEAEVITLPRRQLGPGQLARAAAGPTAGKRSRYIGAYYSEEAAARAYDFVAVQVHAGGPGAKHNFPGEDISQPPVSKERKQSSIYFGVCWHKVTSSWYVQLRDPVTKRSRHIGSYASEEDAAREYDFTAVQAHGPGAKRNFPGEDVSAIMMPVSLKKQQSSCHLGVTWSKVNSAWSVLLWDPQAKRSRYIGNYPSEEDAARAYDFAAVQAHRPGAERNLRTSVGL
ncbi:hypothetical protein FOA52_008895 [Chlamydomonas sp. UWO 241]|nr:hypothetical protein FOA52_008895 [Chlamydomonas sp. UWO 241]